MNDRVEEIDDESDDRRQQHVQGHVAFLARWLPLRPAHDVDSGAITPSEKNTNPANKPKNPTKRRSMSTIGSTLRLLVRRPDCCRKVSRSAHPALIRINPARIQFAMYNAIYICWKKYEFGTRSGAFL
jgi:hypothetical protein